MNPKDIPAVQAQAQIQAQVPSAKKDEKKDEKNEIPMWKVFRTVFQNDAATSCVQIGALPFHVVLTDECAQMHGAPESPTYVEVHRPLLGFLALTTKEQVALLAGDDLHANLCPYMCVDVRSATQRSVFSGSHLAPVPAIKPFPSASTAFFLTAVHAPCTLHVTNVLNKNGQTWEFALPANTLVCLLPPWRTIEVRFEGGRVSHLASECKQMPVAMCQDADGRRAAGLSAKLSDALARGEIVNVGSKHWANEKGADGATARVPDKDSEWAPPGEHSEKTTPAPRLLRAYLAAFCERRLPSTFDALSGKRLGCFCRPGKDAAGVADGHTKPCHAYLLVLFWRYVYGHMSWCALLKEAEVMIMRAREWQHAEEARKEQRKEQKEQKEQKRLAKTREEKKEAKAERPEKKTEERPDPDPDAKAAVSKKPAQSVKDAASKVGAPPVAPPVAPPLSVAPPVAPPLPVKRRAVIVIDADSDDEEVIVVDTSSAKSNTRQVGADTKRRRDEDGEARVRVPKKQKV